MKILKLTAIAIGIIALVACRDRKKKDHTDDTYPDTTNNKSVSDMRANDKQGLQSNSTRTNFDPEEMSALYSHVQMDDDQIKRFEKNYQTHINDMGKSKQNTTTIPEIDRDSILREILSPEQYKRYEDWIEERSR